MEARCCGCGLRTDAPLQFSRTLLRAVVRLDHCAFGGNPCYRALCHPLSTKAKRLQRNKAVEFYRFEAGTNYLSHRFFELRSSSARHVHRARGGSCPDISRRKPHTQDVINLFIKQIAVHRA
ncbi:hypothetical protein TRVL_07366 [Trypanosoma vivax]|nr:hypothetical protein TRVL_07366 [Trypanosoma vivax]